MFGAGDVGRQVNRKGSVSCFANKYVHWQPANVIHIQRDLIWSNFVSLHLTELNRDLAAFLFSVPQKKKKKKKEISLFSLPTRIHAPKICVCLCVCVFVYVYVQSSLNFRWHSVCRRLQWPSAPRSLRSTCWESGSVSHKSVQQAGEARNWLLPPRICLTGSGKQSATEFLSTQNLL